VSSRLLAAFLSDSTRFPTTLSICPTNRDFDGSFSTVYYFRPNMMCFKEPGMPMTVPGAPASLDTFAWAWFG